MSRNDGSQYTHPDMRERIKEEIKASGKGGEPGQWSARKAQLLTQEYERQGGGYTGRPSESQKSLRQWTEEEWQTREGKAEARKDGETKRYLPKEAWEKMSEDEKEAAEKRKREASREGQQYVENPESAKQARKQAQAPPINNYDDLNVEEVKQQLANLSREELERTREYEQRHEDRKTVVEEAERKLRNS
ncbi:MAG: hypothetical protein H0V53_14895 [Rubrobacter sp.]|nr:hypothetical protein [Rubrobacter sp.]